MYRMYVDEVGNHDLKASHVPNHRYLSLTGLILDLEYVHLVVSPKLESLKSRHFASHCDEPLILHRKELVNKNYPFHSLRDPISEAAFNRDLLELLHELKFTVITATMDKLEHTQRYPTWQYHPYHYCQEVLLERFVLWLKRRKERGDVYGEARGRKEDERLKEAFRSVCRQGSSWVSSSHFQALTCDEIKLKKKADNIAGLQLADLVAHPSFKAMLARRNNEALPTGFGGLIAELLEKEKYDRSLEGRIPGYGTKWLP